MAGDIVPFDAVVIEVVQDGQTRFVVTLRTNRKPLDFSHFASILWCKVNVEYNGFDDPEVCVLSDWFKNDVFVRLAKSSVKVKLVNGCLCLYFIILFMK